MLVANNLNHKYAHRKTLDNLCFTFKRGKISCLMGHNGSGKTTLFKILSGALILDSGKIFLNNQSILDKNNVLVSSMKNNLGLVFQHSSLDEKLTVWENLYFAQKLYGLNSEAKINWALEKSGLALRKNDLVKKLSGGMKRRLEIYRAFMHEPSLVLLDEPTQGVDIDEIEKFYIFLKDYAIKRQAIIIFSTHRSEEASKADFLLMLKNGRLIKEGSPKDLLHGLNFFNSQIFLKNYLEKQNLDPVINALSKMGEIKFSNNTKNNIFGQFPNKNLKALLDFINDQENVIEKFFIAKPDLTDSYKKHAEDALL